MNWWDFLLGFGAGLAFSMWVLAFALWRWFKG